MPDNGSFTLRNMKDIGCGMFASTDPDAKQKAFSVFLLSVSDLRPLKGHRFKPYTGKRFDDMAESIRENGVLLPIIVRPTDDCAYEILSGHNRTEAAKAAGLESVPAIVREGLTEDEARLIATVTNLIQRSFAEMCYSERAFALSEYYGAMKNQGRRTDLIGEIENMVNVGNGNASETSGGIRRKSDNRSQAGAQYDLSGRVVADYLRVEKLIDPLKTRLDDGEFAFYAAISLSYLTCGEQRTVEDILDSGHRKLDMKKAEALRNAKNLDRETAEKILAGVKNPKSAKPGAFKLKPKTVSKYFTPEQTSAEIEAIITEALDFYYAHKNQKREVIPHGCDGENVPADVQAGEALVPESPVG
jgi:ParB family chromosome partitioning protein